MHILGIESSCDETAAAVLAGDGKLLSNVVNSQISVHQEYGGVVPELASRQHIANIYPVVGTALEQAGISLSQIGCIGVTTGPGLIGSLLVGHSFAKALSFASGIPFIEVDHLCAHLLSVFLGENTPEFPYIALIVSGGHSSIFLVKNPKDMRMLGRTRDDAAGEAFDKVSKLLDLGYPGGPAISKAAKDGDPKKIAFPRAWLDKDSLDFSFSGLKTAVANHLRESHPTGSGPDIADICASFQEAIVDVLVEKTVHAADLHQTKRIVISGGVAANPRLREHLRHKGEKRNLGVFMPPLEYCTDNAAMVALAAQLTFSDDKSRYDTDVYSRSVMSAA